jgi:hypothetical protein
MLMINLHTVTYRFGDTISLKIYTLATQGGPKRLQKNQPQQYLSITPYLPC